MKKSLSKILVGMMLFGATINCAIAKDYSDLSKSHWAYNEINTLTDQGILVGYPDGKFRPDEPASRAEFANMSILALNQEHALLVENYDFEDVPYHHWAFENIQRAVMFDLIKPQGKEFRPEDTISKAEAVSIITSAINTQNVAISPATAMRALKKYSDYNQIPTSLLVPAGMSEILKMTAQAPESGSKFEPNRKITRAEVAVNLFNMRRAAKENPNKKLEAAMQPVKAEGIRIRGVKINDVIATIPAGTIIPVSLINKFSSQENQVGDVFVSKTIDNIVTRENYLLIAKGSKITGVVTEVKPGRYFIRNAKVKLDTKGISTCRGQHTALVGDVNIITDDNFLMKIFRLIFKGRKINYEVGETVFVKLNNPIKVDLTKTWILN